MRLAGRVALVTGAASGIGRATVELMARQGAAVAVADLNGPGAAEVAAALRTDGHQACAVQGDISIEAEVAAMVAETVGTFGALHILCNNAAITSKDHQARDQGVAEMDVEIWDRTMEVDLRGTMLCCKHAVPAMIRSGGGSIVNISSNASLGGDPGLAAYSSAKAAVNALTRSVATAYGRQGIRCNTISPASIVSPSALGNLSPELLDEFSRHVLLSRLGRPDDIAAMALFLASDDASFITGELISVDGGALSHLPHVGYLSR